MTQGQITTLILAGILSLIPFAFQEVIKEGIKKIFSHLNSRQLTLVFVGLIVLIFGVISITGFSFAAEENDSSEVTEPPETVTTNRSDAEVYAGLAETGLKEGEELLRKKRVKDSTLLANREKIWVYQIGAPISDETDAWQMAKDFNALANVCIFKAARKSFLIICDNGYAETDAQDSLETFSSKVDEIIPGTRVKTIDLMSLCSKRKALIETNKIIKRKKTESFKCYTCD